MPRNFFLDIVEKVPRFFIFGRIFSCNKTIFSARKKSCGRKRNSCGKKKKCFVSKSRKKVLATENIALGRILMSCRLNLCSDTVFGRTIRNTASV